MKTVPLHGPKSAGRVALVDDADYELVVPYRWFVQEHGRPGSRHGPYARAHGLEDWRRMILMHKLITGWDQTDHWNHDGLDNRRSNLRDATRSQNLGNQRPQVGRSSPFKGVYWHRRGRKWAAQIKTSSGRKYLGLFVSETDAARAYDAAARNHFGDFACLNFPDN